MKHKLTQTEVETSHPLPSAAIVLRTPCYFGPEHDALFGWYHQPKQAAQRQTGVVICPPIGHEYVHSHRSLRHLADHLAIAGFPTLRFDYHGSGDSGGVNQDPDRVAAWLMSLRQAMQALRAHTGCQDVSLLGLRMGATFAGIVAGETDVSQLVLWEPCVQGRRFVRELKALHLTAASVEDYAQVNNPDIESAGFVITAQTAQNLGQLNLTGVNPRVKQVLIGERDDAVDDFSLRDAWRAQGIDVEYVRLGGYADMMAETHFTIVPNAAIQQIVNWLSSHCPEQGSANQQAPITNALRYRATMTAHEYVSAQVVPAPAHIINERIIQFGEQQSLFGIVTTPPGEEWRHRPTILLLNSGSVHHIGPHRLYVFLARQFAQMGFRCLRMDFAGLGDSFIDDSAHENHPYTWTTTNDTAAALTALKSEQADGTFVLMGLCSGAYAAFHAGIDIPSKSICECVLINPLTFYWKEGMSLAIPTEAHYRQWNDYMVSVRKWEKWLKLLRGGVSISEIVSTVLERIQILISVKYTAVKKVLTARKSTKTGQRELAEDLQKIANKHRHISFVFSEHDPGYDLLITNAKGAVNKLKKQNRLSLQFISKANHTFSKSAARSVVMEVLSTNLLERYR